MLAKNNIQNKKVDLSSHIADLLPNSVNETVKTLQDEIDFGITFNLKEGQYNYDFVPEKVHYNSDDYFVFSGHLKNKTNTYDVYLKIKKYKLFKCFVQDPQGQDFCLNLDRIFINQ